MKKVILLIAAIAMSAVYVSAQDLETVTANYNGAAEALTTGDKALALEYFQAALKGAEGLTEEQLGEDGATIVSTCKDRIPQIMLSIAKDNIKEKAYDEALVKLQETVESAKLYGIAEAEKDATELIPQVYMQKGNTLLSAKDVNGAVAAFQQVVALDPENGMAYLMMGRAYAATGNVEEAEPAFLKAAEFGKEKDAYKQLSTVYLKKAQSALKAKNFTQAVEFAEKSNSYVESANAYKIAGNAASQAKQNAKAIEYLKKYLELSPNAKDAVQMKYTIAATAQTMGNKEVAKEYYNMILSDPKFGPTAKQMLETL
ncbi:MAG: tetratricopeptide repeat protein [Candidatus Cryptobacteroides sp.]